MANTVIQIKRSSVTTAPTAGSLSAAEPAYSYLSDKLFLGSSDGTQVIEIGGRYYINVATRADQTANLAFDVANAAFDQANASGSGALYIANLAYDKANSANSLAYNTGIGANAYADAVGTAANLYADAVGTAGNSFFTATIAGANTAVGTGANSYAATVGTSANAFASATIAGANTAVGAGANAYSDSTFVKLTASDQTITGNLAITGSLTVSGNTYKIDANTLVVQDPLIYLAGNNYTSDIVDIGFIANYVNATGSNVHTGLYREHVDKMYYLFQGYDKEPVDNHIGAFSNNMTLAVLNADLITSNLSLGGQNAIVWITSAYDKANAANVLAFNTGVGANAYADAVGTAANAYADAVGTAANAFASATIAGANTAVGTGANSYAATVGTSANLYAAGIGTAGNSFFIATIAGANTAVGAGANAYADLVGAAANTNAADASYINTGTLAVAYGGTGLNTLSNNGVLFGNTTSPIRLASTSTEGHVLQANQYGTPFFGMLDGGTF